MKWKTTLLSYRNNLDFKKAGFQSKTRWKSTKIISSRTTGELIETRWNHYNRVQSEGGLEAAPEVAKLEILPARFFLASFVIILSNIFCWSPRAQHSSPIYAGAGWLGGQAY